MVVVHISIYIALLWENKATLKLTNNANTNKRYIYKRTNNKNKLDAHTHTDHTHGYTHTDIHTHGYTHGYGHTHIMDTYTYTHTHTYTHADTHTHTHTRYTQTHAAMMTQQSVSSKRSKRPPCGSCVCYTHSPHQHFTDTRLHFASIRILTTFLL